MKSIKYMLSAACAVLFVTVGALQAGEDKRPGGDKPVERAEKKDEAGKDDRAIVNAQKWSYPLTTCPISGEDLAVKHVDFVVNGRMVRTCCADCQAKVVKDPVETIKKIDAAVITAQKANYPLTTCAVTDAKLDDKAMDYVVGTRLVRLANRDAIAGFERDPKAAMAKIDAAYIKAQKDSYPVKKCIVSGEALGGMGEPVDKLYGTTLVRFCCNACVKGFEKDSEKFMKELADARAKGPSKG
ncbi:MAG: hypothetical protein SGI72_00520 [Planctomycetota bacterium]|nr:hypothetical protein [Planctomycetota bacterium]